ncbi:PAS domain S-box-containing protein/diguanylate cyclase (GGDEF)-like protein [Thiogranum longum]|uniref:PAS domain S-box-containing protein/diguanylate cyclase (GGDEF)-like protein n=1 Tax=Thiogranum longum TaxID=1537524 RepID=A0A4R1H900_9GAMM|nr:EAL domain-containing protein [Thiogranum longum]TCK18327.1 PAS domain S-box-containing protein/diguanylate cyclase (GGDEF)-like protein [Thiogranum longum]
MSKRSVNILMVGSTTSCDAVQDALKDADFAFNLLNIFQHNSVSGALTSDQLPDVIICEPVLEDFSAQDLPRLLQQHGCENLPVILVAGTGSEPEAIRCLDNGIEQLVVNTPASLARLCALVPYVVRQAEEKARQQALAEELQESRERYLDIFDNTSDLIQCLSKDGSFLYTNRAWRETMGYSVEEISHLLLADVLHADSLACCHDRFSRLKKGESFERIDFKYVTKTGEIVHLEGDCGSIFKGGEAVSTRGIFRNVSDTVKSEQARKVSEARYQTLYENAPDIYSIVNARGEFESINRTGAEMLGYEVDELVGQPATMVIHPEDCERVIAYITERFADPVEKNGLEYRKVRKDGSVLWVHQRVSLDPDTSQPRMLVLCRDISEQHELRKQLSYQATHDELTQLINRREFDARLRRMLAASMNTSDHHVLCYLDLDQFKVINDTCGHSAGDELLRQVASLLSRQIRSRDTLARLGGDEFAILMEHCPLEQAEILANRIREMIEDFRFQWKARRFSIGASIGVVPVQHSGSVEDVLSLADSACYEAKQLGRNRVHVFRPGDRAIIGKVGDGRWASRITEALDNDAFSLFAQEITPCCGTKGGQHIEILLRLRDNEVMVNPGAFMPVAERYNLSGKLDQWVLDQAMTWFENHPDALAELEVCSINLSALSLCDDAFRNYALERIDGSLVPASKLCFEVTETAAISNISQATQFMLALRNQGCLFALDDFGSGLSSLAYLKDLPVDIVKIDGAFIRNIANSEVDRMMVKSICEIARMMNMKTTAEYVESEESLQVLRETGVDFVQGFHIGHPIPLDEFAGPRQQDAEILHFNR